MCHVSMRRMMAIVAGEFVQGRINVHEALRAKCLVRELFARAIPLGFTVHARDWVYGSSATLDLGFRLGLVGFFVA